MVTVVLQFLNTMKRVITDAGGGYPGMTAGSWPRLAAEVANCLTAFRELLTSILVVVARVTADSSHQMLLYNSVAKMAENRKRDRNLSQSQSPRRTPYSAFINSAKFAGKFETYNHATSPRFTTLSKRARLHGNLNTSIYLLHRVCNVSEVFQDLFSCDSRICGGGGIQSGPPTAWYGLNKGLKMNGGWRWNKASIVKWWK